MSKTWQFRESEPYLEEVPDELADTEDATAYKTNIIYDGEPISVTWFPERMGVEISGGADLDEKVGKDAAIFGTVLIKLLKSGANCFKEL